MVKGLGVGGRHCDRRTAGTCVDLCARACACEGVCVRACAVTCVRACKERTCMRACEGVRAQVQWSKSSCVRERSCFCPCA